MSSTLIQIRHVPPGFLRRLRGLAAIEGVSLSDYILP
jgi:hypothetical protein